MSRHLIAGDAPLPALRQDVPHPHHHKQHGEHDQHANQLALAKRAPGVGDQLASRIQQLAYRTGVRSHDLLHGARWRGVQRDPPLIRQPCFNPRVGIPLPHQEVTSDRVALEDPVAGHEARGDVEGAGEEREAAREVLAVSGAHANQEVEDRIPADWRTLQLLDVSIFLEEDVLYREMVAYSNNILILAIIISLFSGTKNNLVGLQFGFQHQLWERERLSLEATAKPRTHPATIRSSMNCSLSPE